MSNKKYEKFEKQMNEGGFILITSILILLVLTLVATAMYNSSFFEIMIAGSQKITHEQFYKADAGINATLAQNVPPVAGLGVSLQDTSINPDTFTCDDTAGITEFTKFDVDADGTDDVFLYLLGRSGSPPEIRVLSCATEGNVLSGVYAGLRYGTPPGAQPGTGDILEYNSQ